MRLGVLDVGSNTVHLLVVDAHPGARPLPATSHKVELQLAQHLLSDGRIGKAGEKALVEFVASCLEVAEDQGVEEMLAFATSALREAPNGDEVLAKVRAETGVALTVLMPNAELDLALKLLKSDVTTSIAVECLGANRFGFDSVVVWALADNDNACQFYKNAGGRKVARASERFGDVQLTKIAFAWGRGS